MELYKEFLKELHRPYSVLPLIRPTRSNPEARKLHSLHIQRENLNTHALGKGSLQRQESEVKEGVEVIIRPGVSATSKRDDTGEKVMWVARPKKKK